MSVNEAEFEAAFQDALTHFPDPSEEQKQSVHEDLLLSFRYPGEFVVYVDRWAGPKGTAPLRREVIHHHPDLAEVQQAVTAAEAGLVGTGDKATVMLCY